MKRPMRVAIAATMGIATLVASWGWYVSHPSLWPEYRQATALIHKVEQFKSSHGRVPNDLLELTGQAESLEGQVFYQATSRMTYQVWFGRSLGESYTFDSSTRDWH